MDDGTLRRLLSLANAFKEGDLSVGGTADDRLRADARGELRAVTVGDIHRTPLVNDGVTAALDASRDRRADSELTSLTVDDVRAALVGPRGVAWARQYGDALASETIAAAAKIMTDDELSSVARSLFNPLDGSGVTIGAPSHFGSRIQPNSPGDDEREILFSIFEGLSYGCGDVILGLNPASADVDTIIRLEQLLEQVVRRLGLPTRYCVLSDIVTQCEAQRRTKVDVGFQSLAGTSAAIAGMVGLDVDGVLDLAGTFSGLYFETGQGSEVTNDAAAGVDMVTLEARSYGVARHIRNRSGARWMIVNDVAGFIGPEVFRTAAQLERACLEDVVMAKLHGLTMGLDVCATFHMGIEPRELRRLTSRIVERAAPAYLMAVAGNADPMLGYMTTSFREHPPLKRHVGRQMTSGMQARLAAPLTAATLYASYVRAGGDRRSAHALEEEGRRQLHELRDRGFDLDLPDAGKADARLDRIYTHACRALHAIVDDGVVRDAAPRSMRVRTAAATRDEFLAHPAAGECLREDDARAVASLYRLRAPQVQLIVSDGLNANAVNEQLRRLLPGLRKALASAGHHVGDTDIVVQNGRVRVGYEIGGLVDAAVVVHMIGERPGTGLNALSAYITYGRDEAGLSQWSRSLDHSRTAAICGIHANGKPTDEAVSEIARVVSRSIERRRSGVDPGS
jgi:ethanolamine ammonia-lyase large subunit